MPQAIATLPSGQISRFLMRHRRGETLERLQSRLDLFLQDILGKANEFVPSEAGALLLDDPRAKMFDKETNRLTAIAVFGEHAEGLLGQGFSIDQGLYGEVYTGGRATRAVIGHEERGLNAELEERGLALRSLLGVPVVLGTAVCGVLLLVNRWGRDCFSREERTLMEVFAGFISSSIQNMLDGLRARELAQRDDLTGLHNDRYLHHRLREEIRKAHDEGLDLCLIFIDLDHFKTINDRYGHLEGSRTLHLVGILLENEIPKHAVAARYGGDEFVVLLPGTDAEGGMSVGERLRARLASTPFVVDRRGAQGPVHLSASLGVASLREHVAPDGSNSRWANALIRLADTAMYAAKAAGRDKVSLAQYEHLQVEEEVT